MVPGHSSCGTLTRALEWCQRGPGGFAWRCLWSSLSPLGAEETRHNACACLARLSRASPSCGIVVAAIRGSCVCCYSGHLVWPGGSTTVCVYRAGGGARGQQASAWTHSPSWSAHPAAQEPCTSSPRTTDPPSLGLTGLPEAAPVLPQNRVRLLVGFEPKGTAKPESGRGRMCYYLRQVRTPGIFPKEGSPQKSRLGQF